MIERVNFRKGDKEQQRQLLLLLSEAFGSEYLHYYELHLDALASPDTTILLADEGKIIAHIQLVPYLAKLSSSSMHLRCAYMYAVCTAKSHQGQGIMSLLLRELLHKELKVKGYDITLLVPADRDLITYYERFGFAFMTGEIYMKAPKESYPAIRPDIEAELYMKSAEELDAQFDEANYQHGSTCRHPQKWVPFTPKQVGWMSYPLSEVPLPSDTILVNPLT